MTLTTNSPESSTTPTVHHTTHEINIDAPAEVVYELVANASAWPERFTPTVHVERTEIDATNERLRIWATANGEIKTWTSRRVLDPEFGKIQFRQEVSSHPVASMSGEWIVTAQDKGCRLTLLHSFTAVEDDPANVEWIREATDRNSNTELANIKSLAESQARMSELTFSFDDSVLIQGSAATVYELLYRAQDWPELLPHVAALTMTEDIPNVQFMAMDTLAKDGSTHTTESIRVCFPSSRIVYKQLVPPSLMTVHTGEWSIEDTGEGVRVTSQHTIVVKESAITTVLGPEATVESAKAFIRQAAGGNSLATLTIIKNVVEAA